MAAVVSALMSVFNIELFAVPHVYGNVVFLIATVCLPMLLVRQHFIADLPQETPVSRVRVPELKGNPAACRTSLAEIRFDVALVDIEVHGMLCCKYPYKNSQCRVDKGAVFCAVSTNNILIKRWIRSA